MPMQILQNPKDQLLLLSPLLQWQLPSQKMAGFRFWQTAGPRIRSSCFPWYKGPQKSQMAHTRAVMTNAASEHSTVECYPDCQPGRQLPAKGTKTSTPLTAVQSLQNRLVQEPTGIHCKGSTSTVRCVGPALCTCTYRCTRLWPADVGILAHNTGYRGLQHAVDSDAHVSTDMC